MFVEVLLVELLLLRLMLVVFLAGMPSTTEIDSNGLLVFHLFLIYTNFILFDIELTLTVIPQIPMDTLDKPCFH